MKKVGFIIETFPSATEHFILNELLEFQKNNLDFEVFALRKGEAITRKSEKVTVHYFRTTKNILKGIKSIYILKKKSIINKNNSSLKDFIKLFKKVLLALNLGTTLRQKKIEHVHAHFAYITTEIAYYIQMLFDISFSFTCHAKDIYVNDKLKLNSFIKSASFVLTCTEYNLNYLNEITNDSFKTKIHHVYHGISFEKILSSSSIDTIISKKREPLKIICVARLVEKKGIIYLLNALSLFKKENISFLCNIVGDGPEYKKLRKFCKNNDLINEVNFSGNLTHTEVINKIRESEVFILPSVIATNGDRDGLPNSIVEAMMLGKIVIASSLSAIPEIIKHKYNGLLVEPNCEVSIYKTLKEIILKQNNYKEMKQNASNSIKKELDINLSTKNLLSIYNKYLTI